MTINIDKNYQLFMRNSMREVLTTMESFNMGNKKAAEAAFLVIAMNYVTFFL